MFKDEQKKKKAKNKKVNEDKGPTYSVVKSYFVHFDSISPHGHEKEDNYVLLQKSVSEARRLFMHIHTLKTLEKYMARLVSVYFSFIAHICWELDFVTCCASDFL